MSGAVQFGIRVKLFGEKYEARVDGVVSGRGSWDGGGVCHRCNMWKAWCLLFEWLGGNNREVIHIHGATAIDKELRRVEK